MLQKTHFKWFRLQWEVCRWWKDRLWVVFLSWWLGGWEGGGGGGGGRPNLTTGLSLSDLVSIHRCRAATAADASKFSIIYLLHSQTPLSASPILPPFHLLSTILSLPVSLSAILYLPFFLPTILTLPFSLFYSYSTILPPYHSLSTILTLLFLL